MYMSWTYLIGILGLITTFYFKFNLVPCMKYCLILYLLRSSGMTQKLAIQTSLYAYCRRHKGYNLGVFCDKCIMISTILYVVPGERVKM